MGYLKYQNRNHFRLFLGIFINTHTKMVVYQDSEDYQCSVIGNQDW